MARNAHQAHTKGLEKEEKRAATWLDQLSKKAKKGLGLKRVSVEMPPTGEGYWQVETALRDFSREQLVNLVYQIAVAASEPEPEVEAELEPLEFNEVKVKSGGIHWQDRLG